MGTNKFWRMFLVALLAALGQRLACAADAQREDMLKLANDKSCTLCHGMEPHKGSASELLPFAPAWKDIARKYRGQKDAEDKLTRIVLGGTRDSADGRHWKNKFAIRSCWPTRLKSAKRTREDSCAGYCPWTSSTGTETRHAPGGNRVQSKPVAGVLQGDAPLSTRINLICGKGVRARACLTRL